MLTEGSHILIAAPQNFKEYERGASEIARSNGTGWVAGARSSHPQSGRRETTWELSFTHCLPSMHTSTCTCAHAHTLTLNLMDVNILK